MKNILTILFVVLFFQTAIAQNKADKKLVAAVENLRKQMIDPEKANLDALLMDGLSYGHSTGRLDTKVSLMESLLNGTSDFVEGLGGSLAASGTVAFIASASTNTTMSVYRIGP